VRKKKNETADPQNSTFASSDTQAKASACKRAVFLLTDRKKTILRHGLADMDISFENYKVSRKLYRVGKKYKT